MKLSKIKIKNFKCYGDNEVIINVKEDLTAFVGANSTGKSATFQALLKIFGTSFTQKEITRSDFHLPKGTSPSSLQESSFYIETAFDFLDKDGNHDDNAIPHFFDQMVVNDGSSPPYLRIRLEATWQKSELSPEGEIESKLVYITAPEGQEGAKGENRTPVPSRHRLLIQAMYVPAIRKPSEQLKFASGTILWRLMQKVKWGDAFMDELQNRVDQVNSHLSSHTDFDSVKTTIGDFWKNFHGDERYQSSSLTVGSSDFNELLKKIEIEFLPTETGRPYQIGDLGEGLRSLFYLSLVCSLLKIEQDYEPEAGEVIQKPLLTLLIVEEPENHISPHLLGKVIKNLLEIASQPNAQTILSSHTPAIIQRIDPESVRHLRIEKNEYCTIVKEITLPEKTDEAYKYVKEAVRNYPEIYFASIVVIGEGDSEEIVFNRFSRVVNQPADEMGITIAPLGHRFVNHIWKLLNDLSIPHVTLLDLDFERHGGGWGRIKYIVKQLRKIGKAEKIGKQGGENFTDDEIDGMHKWDIEERDTIYSWVSHLEQYDVYYSQPLDLDFLFLSEFETEYKRTLPKGGGPQIPDKVADPDAFTEKLEKGIQATLKPAGGSGESYTDDEKELMIWYNYFFLGRGKPSTHIAALAELDDQELKDRMPDVFKKIFKRINELVNS
ncbi:MAG: AAA family ATPase [Lewinellaceae bacterium]|nr:AAA family ATPase [Lewinellaceae bacterium]